MWHNTPCSQICSWIKKNNVSSRTACLLSHFTLLYSSLMGQHGGGAATLGKLKNMWQHFLIQKFPEAKQIGIGSYQHQLTVGWISWNSLGGLYELPSGQHVWLKAEKQYLKDFEIIRKIRKYKRTPTKRSIVVKGLEQDTKEVIWRRDQQI